ncbi:MAG TPA: cysteine desulfurase family protein [Alphaproteobacteria bacterium]
MPHYLDYNATAPVRPEARETMIRALELSGNPSSVHAAGREARAAVEEARRKVAALAGARPAEVVFTGSGSEANNFALAGPRPGRLVVSAIEHASVLRPAAERPGRFAMVPVTAEGIVDLEALARVLAEGGGDEPTLVSVMMANNETGVIQPVAEVVRTAKRAGALVHCDAIQAAGRIALDFAGLGCDLMTLSAHKIGGPKGVGALVRREGLALAPLVSGGGQERGSRAGTENVPGIAGFGAAAEAAARELAGGVEIERQRRLRDRIEDAVRGPGREARIVGAGAPRLANTSCIALPGARAETQVIACDLAGVAVSAGSACSSGKVEPSHVLAAMGLAPELVSSAIRVSLGYASTDADIEAFVAAWTAVRARAAAGAAPAQERQTV